ncbi:EF-hand domain-containing protein [Pseudomonas sp. Marseille-Q1929]|uniref:EF-hand domain-containing protein n=1 Tax=Pseudomonas sp. Marseille-Q1929 TaxID=2730402 RepID=UPI001A8EE961|nr:EF-hand domain-containing protein [Pseudomonas sp. Marseille-Q1929]MBO0493777.1 type III secretion effector protein [Pseudomonas sp. Marseille-Q1929]
MSVSTLDSSVPTSSNLETSLPAPQAKANRQAPSAPSFDGQSATNVNFHSRETPAGPVFGDQNDRRHHHNPLAMPPSTLPPSFMEQSKQWLSQWFGGCRPPCNSAPPRPHPTIGRPHPKPRPDYASQSHEQLTQALMDNFKAFTGSDYRSMSLRDIRAMANRQPGSDPIMNNNIRLAKELLNRPDLLQALDRKSGTGATDNRFSKQDLRDALNDTNYFRYQSDKEIAGEMLSHFDELVRRWGGQISIRDLKKLASQPLTGDSPKDHLIQLAQAVLSRGNLLKAMDRNGDGYLSRWEIQRLSR